MLSLASMLINTTTPAKISKESWRPVPGYEGLYEVSDLGRVKSLERTCFNGHVSRKVRERILRPTQLPCQTVGLCRDGLHETWTIAQLVLTVFVRPARPGEVATHKDGDKWHHAVGNLEWIDKQDQRHPYYGK